MARQLIDIGFNDNDGTGDRLRDAMRKVNQNFEELYEGTVDTNVQIVTNTIAITELNGNLTLDPNGTGTVLITKGLTINTAEEPTSKFIVLDTDGTDLFKVDPLRRNATFDTTTDEAGFFVTGNMVVMGDSTSLASNVSLGSGNSVINFQGNINSSLIPSVDSSYNLGANGKRWNALYANTLNVTTISLTNANIANLVSANLAHITTEITIGNLVLRSNELVNTISNQNIDLKPSGTGIVYVPTKIKVGDELSALTPSVLNVTDTSDNPRHISMQNFSSGSTARGSLLIPNDSGNLTANYLEVGINSSNYDNASFDIHTAGSGYLITKDVDLFVGTAANGKDLVLHAGGTATENIVARVTDGSLILGNDSNTGELLQVNGDIKITGDIILQGRTLGHASVSTSSATNYTFALTDAENTVIRSNSTSGTVVLPTNANVAFATGTTLTVIFTGTGDLAWDQQSGVTVRSRDGALAFRGQYAAAAAIKIGTDEWVITGDLT